MNSKLKRNVLSISIIFTLITAGFIVDLIFDVIEDEGSAEAMRTIYVGGAGPGNYSTIQSAINGANMGDLVRVYEGTYNENLQISKSLTLIGNGTDNTTIDGGLNGNVIYITANHVNISGFNIINSGTSSYDSGIELKSAWNCRIENNNFSNNSMGIYFNWISDENIVLNNSFYLNHLDGIYFLNSNNNIIKSNTFNSNSRYGTQLRISKVNTFINNTFLLNGLFLNGMQLTDWNTHTIYTNNTVNGKPIYYWKNQNGGTIPPGAGQVILADCKNIIVENQNTSFAGIGITIGYSANNIIRNNICNSNYYGMYIYYHVNSNTITNNTCNWNKIDGIHLFFGSSNIITNNSCNSNQWNGIYIWGSSQFNIVNDNNCISNNASGIYFYWFSDSNTAVGNKCNNNRYGFYLDNSSFNVSISYCEVSKNIEGIHIDTKSDAIIYYNRIFNNIKYGVNNNAETRMVDAINNWWGEPSGPYHPSSNQEGLGDNVSDNVIFDPWFTSGGPNIITDDKKIATEDMYYEVNYQAINLKKIPMIWIQKDNASWLNWNSSLQRLYGTPNNADVGEYWVSVNVTNDHGDFHKHEFILFVKNAKPLIITENIPSATEDVEYLNDYDSNDDGQGAIKWILKTDCDWLVLDINNGLLRGMPNNDDVGEYYVNVIVDDGNGGFDDTNFTLTVFNSNDAPIINTQDKLIAIEDEYYQVNYSATDVDVGDILTWSLISNADWLNWGNINHTLYGNPKNNDVGKYDVRIIVIDGNGGRDEHNFILNVLNVNDAPEINKTFIYYSFNEDTIDYGIELYDLFKDIDGDELTFRCEGNKNITVSISDDGIVELIPKDDWSGVENLTFYANDSQSEISDYISITILPVNDAPTNAILMLAKMRYYEGESQPAKGNATDVDIPYGDELTYTWFSNITGKIGIGQEINLSLPDGIHTIILNVTDKSGAWCIISTEREIFKIDSDNDGYPDDIDAYPNDPTKWEKEDDKSEEKDDKVLTWITIGVIVTIIIIVIIIIFFLLIKRKKNNIIKSKMTPGSDITEAKKSQTPQKIQLSQQKYCSTCGLLLKYYQQNNKYYCNQCKKYE